MSGGKIMVVDDEPQLRRVMRIALAERGYEVIDSRCGEEALEQFRSELPELLLIDLNMPGMNGFELCEEIRSRSDVPIIVLSVRNAEKDVVRALDAGADDYLTKPFRVEELMARIRAVLRRAVPEWTADSRILNLGPVKIDFEAREALTPKGKIHLTPKEFGLLRHMASHAGKALSRRKLLQAVWGPDYGDEADYLRVVVNQLRKKIEIDPSNPAYIVTEPRVGYRFVMPDGAPENT